MPPTPPSPPSRSDQTREALLQAGTSLFAERGFDGVTIEQIAREAGVNKALISYHFGGKRGLYGAIIATTFAEIQAALSSLAESGGAPEELLERLLDTFRELAENRRPGFPALMLREAIAPGERSFELIAPHLVGMVKVVRGIIDRGIAEGRFRKVDSLLAHLGMVGGMVFFFATQKGREALAQHGAFGSERPTGEAYVEYMKSLMLRGLAVSGPTRRSGAERSEAR